MNYFFSNVKTADERFKVIYNGLNPREFEKKYSRDDIRNEFSIPLNAIVVGHAGRYTWAKNFPVILQIAMRLYDNYEDVYFVCCGSGTDTEIVKYIEKEKTDRIKLLGYRNDIPRLLSMFDIFFFPSLTESQPNSLLEALMAGLPIVASNIEPIKEALPNDLFDQLIAPDNTDEAYSKIEELINDKDKRTRLNRSEWAKNCYDAELKFELFCDALILT